MTEFKFDIEAYLERIRVDSPVSVSEDSLQILHRAQAYTIPFENFDILLGRGVNLSPRHLFEKMVLRPRGGYCFELNGLFFLALQSLGFQVRQLLARVQSRGEPTGRHHELLLINVDGKEWIADVGFGANGLRAPIRFETNSVTEQDGLAFRLIDYPPFGTMLQISEQGQWQDLYSFDLEHVCQADIDSGNHFTSTSPNSFFTWARVATLPNSSGRVSLNDFKLSVMTGNQIQEIQLEPGPGYLDHVEKYFGIVLDEDYAALKPVTNHGGHGDHGENEDINALPL